MTVELDPNPVVGKVRSFLSAREIRYTVEPGPVLRIPHGSAEVTVDFDDLAGAGSVLHISSIVLSHLESDGDDGEFLILRALNDRNRVLRFGSLAYEPERREITLRYSMLGDHLQEEELFNAVSSLAATADDYDDVLSRELGGRRAPERRGS